MNEPLLSGATRMASPTSSLQQELLLKWANEDWTETKQMDKCSTISEESPIIIGGCARSGTTLVRVILDSHSRVVVGPHTNIFLPIPVDVAEVAYKLDIDPSQVQAFATRDRVLLIEALAAMCRRRYGKSIWGEKTARNVHRFQWILKHFPRARILHIIRDGRDVVCSLRQHRKRQIINGEIVPLKNRMPLEACIARWRLSIRDGLQLRGVPNYCEVRYDNLIGRPEETIRNLCGFLGICYEPSMLHFHSFEGPLRDPLRFPQNVEATMPLYSTAVGRWEKELTEEEKSVVNRELGDILAELGYLEP